jgi:hypothetical protein
MRNSLLADAPPMPRPNIWRRLSNLEQQLVVAVLVIAVAVRLHVITQSNINWDEFFYLSQVYDHLRGELDLRLQTIHVHFFGWLEAVSTNEVNQIIAGRTVMLGLHTTSALLLYRLAKRLTDGPAALFAAAAYLSFSFAVRTGASFRTDALATCLVMAGFELLLNHTGSLWRPALAGLMVALAGMVTIKTAIFLPSLAVIFAGSLLHRPTARRAACRAVVTAITILVGFSLFYGLHTLSLGDGITRSSAEVAAGSFSTVITRAGFFPQIPVLLLTLRWDFVYWLFWLLGAIIVVRRAWETEGRNRCRWLEAAALALPVASVAVYRNSFSYFYPSILAPASVLLAVSWQALTQAAAVGHSAFPVVLKIVALAWFVAASIFHGVYVPHINPLEPQRSVVGVIHRMFPTSTPYLDPCSMIASFPQVGFFMTSLGMEAYLHRGEPVLQRAIEEHQPPLLLANHPLLDTENALYPRLHYRQRLLAPDREALASAYIHHWGPIYVAGKRINGLNGEDRARIHLSIAGRYTLEAEGALRIDDRLIQPGQVVDLARGPHTIAGIGPGESATLRWGESLYRPAQPAPQQIFFGGF